MKRLIILLLAKFIIAQDNSSKEYVVLDNNLTQEQFVTVFVISSVIFNKFK